ncbi:MAG: hypothetical protein ABSB19_06750 [Methylomonas sp.]
MKIRNFCFQLGLAPAFLFHASISFALCEFGSPNVVSTVAELSPSSYQYDYDVSGFTLGSCSPNSPSYQNSFALPYFPDANISAIVTPAGWSYQILNEDFFNLGHGAETLVWATTGAGIPNYYYTYNPTTNVTTFTPSGNLDGFGYTAAYSPVSGPDFVSNQGFNLNGIAAAIGDPAVPSSPSAISAGLTTPLPLSSAAPEPPIGLLLPLGILLLSAIKPNRKPHSLGIAAQ